MFDFFFLINVTNVVMKESLWCPLHRDDKGLRLMDPARFKKISIGRR
jgi:hypothetical protein